MAWLSSETFAWASMVSGSMTNDTFFSRYSTPSNFTPRNEKNKRNTAGFEVKQIGNSNPECP
jgi:hypothetical protein